jgi:HAD superfamily hydrolase (TIGR01509 family)
MIKAVIFDFFDVFRTDAYKSWLVANAIPHEGEYFEASRCMDMGELTPQQFLNELSRLQGRTVTLEELEANAKLDKEVVAIADSLRKDYSIALLSNAPSAFIRALFAEHDLERLFHQIVISSEVGMVKPNADIFELTLQRLGIVASQAIFIDDNEEHVRAARGVGIKSVQFTSAKELRNQLNDLGITLSNAAQAD